MSETISNNQPVGNDKMEIPGEKGEYLVFNDLNAFEKAVESVEHIDFNFESLIDVSGDFIEGTEKYLILNIKDNVEEDPNNILFLTERKAFLYSKKSPPLERMKFYQKVLIQPFGYSTILTFIVISKVLSSYKKRLESLLLEIRELENKFILNKYHAVALEVERRHDRLEELSDLVLRLQERVYPQIETEYISFDYRVLVAEVNSLEGRYRRRLSMVRDLRQDFETQTTSELNTKIVKLNDVVKKLTAITVILMIPNLIASHFGMNFVNMPELSAAWAYPAVIIFQFLFMGLGFWWFRRTGWL